MQEKTILVRKKDHNGFMEFIRQVIEYSKDGYEPDYQYFFANSKPHFVNGFCVTLFKKEQEVVQEKTDMDIINDKSSSKEELLSLADKLTIELPEDKKKYPAAIRKYIKETLEKIEEVA